METLLTGVLGLLTGGIVVGIYYNNKLKDLSHQIMDKQTIIRLIKEHGTFEQVTAPKKPNRNYRKTRRPVKKTTAGMNQVAL
jgi:hypothetical protein